MTSVCHIARWALVALLAMIAPSAVVASEDDTEIVLREVLEPRQSDLDEIAERQILRMAVPHNPLSLAFDDGKLIGISVDRARELETHLEEALGSHVRVALLPLPRDRMIPFLIEGRVDVLDANLTVTEARQEFVAFTDPIRSDISEILVTGPAAPEISGFDDLVEVGLHLRPVSSYWGHVEALNAAREAEGKAPIPVTAADDALEDFDLLEMVEAGILPAIIVDSHKAELWALVLENIVLHPDITVNEGGQIAWAVRKDAPKLLEALNGFVATAKTGTLLGNMLDKRYVAQVQRLADLEGVLAEETFADIALIADRHAETYGFDLTMVLAQGFQESRLDQSERSQAGAIGVMQVLPTTAKDPNVAIPDIDETDPNIEAGLKYLRFIRDRYFSDAEIAPFDQVLFALAAYNAGPANIAKARERAEADGADPNVWFDNVETAAARVISREPVNYVRNIVRYAVGFRLAAESEAGRTEALDEAGGAEAGETPPANAPAE